MERLIAMQDKQRQSRKSSYLLSEQLDKKYEEAIFFPTEESEEANMRLDGLTAEEVETIMSCQPVLDCLKAARERSDARIIATVPFAYFKRMIDGGNGEQTRN
jgi:hypothetical protein